MRVLSCVVLVSAAITVWTRAALVFALGPQLTRACLWIAAGGSLCAVLTLAGTRKQGRRQHRLPRPAAGYAAVITAYGAPEVLAVTELPDPVPAAGEVLIRVAAFGLNHAEAYMRSGGLGGGRPGYGHRMRWHGAGRSQRAAGCRDCRGGHPRRPSTNLRSSPGRFALSQLSVRIMRLARAKALGEAGRDLAKNGRARCEQ
jgi:hypothetical protein